LGLLSLEDLRLERNELVDYTLVVVEEFVVHKEPLDELNRKGSGISLYDRNVEWNLLKW
jgi:hypothetical protein